MKYFLLTFLFLILPYSYAQEIKKSDLINTSWYNTNIHSIHSVKRKDTLFYSKNKRGIDKSEIENLRFGTNEIEYSIVFNPAKIVNDSIQFDRLVLGEYGLWNIQKNRLTIYRYSRTTDAPDELNRISIFKVIMKNGYLILIKKKTKFKDRFKRKL